MAFVLDPRLQSDTIHVAILSISDLLIMNDCRYPWAILVPRIEGARELHELDPADGEAVWRDVMTVAKALAAKPRVEKINIGALGNRVAQLHIHVVGRKVDDPAWPGPVWGHSPAVPYDGGAEAELVEYLEKACGDGGSCRYP
jgi:diadenosine tetraphosphate (Ap4A) HIT family hydrolase